MVQDRGASYAVDFNGVTLATVRIYDMIEDCQRLTTSVYFFCPLSATERGMLSENRVTPTVRSICSFEFVRIEYLTRTSEFIKT